MPPSSTGFSQRETLGSLYRVLVVSLQKPSISKQIRRWATALIVALVISLALLAFSPSRTSDAHGIQRGPVPLNWPGNTEWVISSGQATHADELAQYQDAQAGGAVLESGRDLPEETTSSLYAFQSLQPASLTYAQNTRWCPGLQQPSSNTAALAPIDPRLRFLLILGAQKAGTTWLFDALSTHPLFVGATHGYRRGKDRWRKEVHFFDQWPLGKAQDYRDCFPPDRRTAALSGTQPAVFVDASPEYLLTPAAAPRAAQIVPHAKLVIILRDPVARSLSAYRMVQRTVCPPSKPELAANCSLPAFYEVVQTETTAAGSGLPQQCLFTSQNPAIPAATWADCWKCLHSIPKFMCPKLSAADKSALGGCPPSPPLPTTHVSLYAAQIAWWLAFFPPESFLILKSSDLRDPDRAMQALNKVLAHIGSAPGDVASTPPFSADAIADVAGFTGNYSHDLSDADRAAAQELARFYEQPNADLQALMDAHFPGAGFHGFESEFGL